MACGPQLNRAGGWAAIKPHLLICALARSSRGGVSCSHVSPRLPSPPCTIAPVPPPPPPTHPCRPYALQPRLSPSSEHLSSACVWHGKRAESEYAAAPRCPCQHLLVRPHRPTRYLPHVHLTGMRPAGEGYMPTLPCTTCCGPHTCRAMNPLVPAPTRGRHFAPVLVGRCPSWRYCWPGLWWSLRTSGSPLLHPGAWPCAASPL